MIQSYWHVIQQNPVHLKIFFLFKKKVKQTDNKATKQDNKRNQRPSSLRIASPTYLSLSTNNLNNTDSKSNSNLSQTHIQIVDKNQKQEPQENRELSSNDNDTTCVDIFEQEKMEILNAQIANMKLKASTQNLANDSKSNKIFSDLIINELRDLEKKNILSHSLTSSSISYDAMQNFLTKSPSSLTINKTLCSTTTNDDTCPLASEEQSCMSTPNLTKLSPSIDSIYKQQQQQHQQQQTEPLTAPPSHLKNKEITENLPKK